MPLKLRERKYAIEQIEGKTMRSGKTIKYILAYEMNNSSWRGK